MRMSQEQNERERRKPVASTSNQQKHISNTWINGKSETIKLSHSQTHKDEQYSQQQQQQQNTWNNVLERFRERQES